MKYICKNVECHKGVLRGTRGVTVSGRNHLMNTLKLIKSYNFRRFMENITYIYNLEELTVDTQNMVLNMNFRKVHYHLLFIISIFFRRIVFNSTKLLQKFCSLIQRLRRRVILHHCILLILYHIYRNPNLPSLNMKPEKYTQTIIWTFVIHCIFFF